MITFIDSLKPTLLAQANPTSDFTGSRSAELVYPFHKTHKRPNINRRKIRNPKSLASLQQYFLDDHLNVYAARLKSFDKYYLINRSGYGISKEPKSVSNGLSACLTYAGSDAWKFAQAIANTRLLFSSEAAWLKDWLAVYYPEYRQYFLQLETEILTLRSKEDFQLTSTAKYEYELYSGEIIRGVNSFYQADFIKVEVEDFLQDDPNESDERKSPCPHTRKQHWKRVRYGKGRRFTKWVEIAETSVNPSH